MNRWELDHLETRHDRPVPPGLRSTSVYTVVDIGAQPVANYDRHVRLNQVAAPIGSKHIISEKVEVIATLHHRVLSPCPT